jgi:hypothetical protein
LGEGELPANANQASVPVVMPHTAMIVFLLLHKPYSHATTKVSGNPIIAAFRLSLRYARCSPSPPT